MRTHGGKFILGLLVLFGGTLFVGLLTDMLIPHIAKPFVFLTLASVPVVIGFKVMAKANQDAYRSMVARAVDEARREGKDPEETRARMLWAINSGSDDVIT